jgi:cyclic pyranopterin phosphate synthase
MFAGIDAAAAPGLTPVKINMVVKRGINDYAIIEMAEHLRATGRILRLIEYMDVGTTYGWRVDDVVPGAEIAAAIHARWLLESSRPTTTVKSRPATATATGRRNCRSRATSAS